MCARVVWCVVVVVVVCGCVCTLVAKFGHIGVICVLSVRV